MVASVLMALGMMMVPPATISLPFKLMLFVLVDGWQLLVGSLAQSFTPEWLFALTFLSTGAQHDTGIGNGNGRKRCVSP